MVSTKPKIAYITDVVWPYNKGGKEKRLYDISTRLATSGYDVHIYTMKWWTGADTIIENGVHLHALCPLYPLYSGPRRSISQGLLFGLACLKLIREDWDIIEVDHMPFFPLYFTKLICIIKNKPMFATWHEVWGRQYWLEYMGVLGNISYLIERLSVLLPNKIISVSSLTTQQLKKSLSVTCTIITIPNGVDVSHIKKIKPSSIKSDLIFVGRLLSHKNLNILLDAIGILKKQNSKIKCLIIGDGPAKKTLEKKSIKMGLEKNIKFYGFVERMDQVYSYIKSSKVFVLPSDREGFGIVVIESLACNTPVVTVDSPGNASKDLIKNGINGYVSKLNPIDLANNLQKTLDTRAHLKPSTNIENYDWDKVIKQLKTSYILNS